MKIESGGLSMRLLGFAIDPIVMSRISKVGYAAHSRQVLPSGVASSR
jgi:hypothetical protein